MALVKYNNNSISAITTPGTMATGGKVLIKEQTASSSSTISFVHGSGGVVLDNTYPIYLFKFINLHNSDDDNQFSFNLSADSGSNYNVSKTSTHFYSINTESGSNAFSYYAGGDLANGTGFQITTLESGADSDECDCGELYLFNPSSTTFVKHFICVMSELGATPRASNNYIAGYGNTTSAINGVQFKYASQNIDSGTIKLYGIKDS
tara:strand:- start:1067 stop:1687 length:621 start_codon:yes stop_codon:yes gene_type:complete